MKTLTVRMLVELQVPDEWELAVHESGMTVLKIGDNFVDFDITPLVAADNTADAEWSDDNQELTLEVLDCVTGLDVDMELNYQQ